MKERPHEALSHHTRSEHHFSLNLLHLRSVSVTQKQTAVMFVRCRHTARAAQTECSGFWRVWESEGKPPWSVWAAISAYPSVLRRDTPSPPSHDSDRFDSRKVLMMAGATSTAFAFPFISAAFIIMRWLPDLIKVWANGATETPSHLLPKHTLTPAGSSKTN